MEDIDCNQKRRQGSQLPGRTGSGGRLNQRKDFNGVRKVHG